MRNEDMKCICGYKYERDIGNEEYDLGDEPFKQIQIYMEGAYCEVRDNKREEHYIYACPKCGTLKINLGDE